MYKMRNTCFYLQASKVETQQIIVYTIPFKINQHLS